MNSNKNLKQVSTAARHFGMAAVIAALAGQAPLAFAQNEQRPQVKGLEELVITAQRREESAQDASIAIATVTGNALEQSNITRPGALTDLVPALQAVDVGGSYSAFWVRGVGGNAANGFSDSALAFNVDGAVVGKQNTTGFFYDVERVEVLKGPQGTLYGRNATGGAINVITNKPQFDEFGGSASLQFGNYGAEQGDFVLNAPISDTQAMRFVGYFTQHEGYNLDGTDDQDDMGGRFSYRYEPSENFDLFIGTDYFVQKGKLNGANVLGIATPSAFSVEPNFSGGDRLGLFSPQVSDYVSTQSNAVNGNFMVPFEDVGGDNKNQFYGINSTMNWHLDAGTITFIPSYRVSDLDYIKWSGGVHVDEISKAKQQTAELRFTSDESKAFRYILGLYYYDEENDVPRFQINQQSILSTQEYVLNTESQAAFANMTYDLTNTVRLNAGVRYTADDRSFDGQITANTIVCPAGFLGCVGNPPNVFPYTQTENVPPSFPPFVPGADGTFTTPPNVRTVDQSESWSETTYRVGLDWDVAEDNLLYVAYETGYKAGGFFFTVDDPSYEPEYLDAFSIGSKNRFLDDRLQLNAEIFYWKYEGQHFPHLSSDSSGASTFPTENVGDATIQGVDLDMLAQLTDTTMVNMNVQYNDAVYDNFVYTVPNQNGGFNNGTGCPNAQAPTTVYTVDCSGERPPYAPEWSLSAGVEQSFPLAHGGELAFNARVHYQSETMVGTNFLPIEMQDSYQMWDFDLTYYSPGQNFTAGAYINNAFDENVIVNASTTPLSTFTASGLRPPRTYGVRFGMEF